MADSTEIKAIGKLFAGDVVSAKLAAAYITVDGKRYLLFQAKNLKAAIEKTKKEVPILGQVMSGNRAVGSKGSGSLTIYYNTNKFDEMMEQYVKTGQDVYFDMQIINEDPMSKAGRKTVVLLNCNIDKVDIANFDADGDWLEQDIDFTFEGFKRAEKFTELSGMSV